MITANDHMTSKTILILLTMTAAATATADALYDELVVCRGLPDDARLICYDAAVDRSRQGASGRPPASAAAPAATVAATAPPSAGAEAAASSGSADLSQEDLFGKNQAEVERSVEEATGTERIDSLSGTISRLQQSGYDKVVITLDNGQIWRQIDASSLRLRVGDSVRIERGAIGSYMLQKKGSKRSMRVTRED